ncbi:ABC transporter family protein [Theileria parva strain Muguga]|uniref:ABC transporter, putative n=1 Tax=Theileria parva TaxID=5875 RepID=Q4N138_THEPA|nr:ABC transporter family protein [Theileria parva strain Muguga]EAN32268.1 ABC transporter family protein [Theileria parva strain Muguga]|eukprot:XP_764551.1 ABC transporter [Theileria parva strain Muguga]
MGKPQEQSLLSHVKYKYEKEEVTEDCNFWESEINLIKKCSKVEGKDVSYYGRRNVFGFLFFHWITKWISILSNKYLEPYKLHPLPIADQILYWQPIFSKHVSDSLIELEMEEYEYNQLGKNKKKQKPKKLILFRAIVFTFWRRILLAMIGMISMNILSMSIAILLSKLFKLMISENFNYGPIFGLILVIIVLELSKGICIDHVTFYIQRLIVMVDYSLGITIFHHGLCLRRNYSNLDSTKYNCNSVLHSCSPGSNCFKNPFLCSARRHKNFDITPKMYSYKFVDCYYVTLIFDNLTDIVNFLTNFIYGIILIHVQMKIKIFTVSIISVSLVVFMIFVEIFNSFLLKFYYALRDHRISKSYEIITNFKIIKTLVMEDIAENMITDVRNDELVMIAYRFFLSLVNKVLYLIIVTCALVIIIKDFVEQLKNTSDLKEIDSSSIITLLFILLKIIDPMFLLPLTLRMLILVINSYNRIEFFIRTCSPNYYQSDKFLVDPNLKNKLFSNRSIYLKQHRCLVDYSNLKIPEQRKDSLVDGSVIKFDNASFTWIFSREDLVKNNEIHLKNINFQLNGGEIAIITGPQGCGKSNFIKSILGEMTLVGGSMYVKPLSKSMPIFYASQDVWLKRGTIRANITFGHRFDEDIYNSVIKAVELETDIFSWQEEDLRTIVDGGFELSGGQRVRVELARAVYAYMIYSKMAKEQSRRLSFLMCLDSVFLGLDPFVGGNIFNNLFNSKNGLLHKQDLSIVLTATKRLLETCLSTSSPNNFGDIKIYTIFSKKLILKTNLRDFILKFNPAYSTTLDTGNTTTGGTIKEESDVDGNVMESGVIELYRKCKSTEFQRVPRRTVVRDQYDDKSGYGSHKFDSNISIKSIVLKPLLIYISSAGYPFFAFLFFLISCTILDNVRYIFASKLSNFVNEHLKNLENFLDDKEKCNSVHSLIKEYSTKSLTRITYVSIFVIIASVSVVVAMTLVSLKASLNIHEYSLDSALYKSSAKIKIKRYISDVFTFLSCDTLYIDLTIGYYLFESFIIVVETIIHMIMLVYLLPTSVFFVLIAMVLIIKFPVFSFLKGLSNIRFAYMASTNRLNCVLNDSISGSIVYRSYRKETELVTEFVEHADYNARSRFMERSVFTWTSIMCRCIFSVMIFLIILTPITISKFVDYDIKIGYYGLAFSLSLNVTNRFSKLLRLFTKLQLYLCSVIRFTNFIPEDEKLNFNPPKNIYVEGITINNIPSQNGNSLPEDQTKSGKLQDVVSNSYNTDTTNTTDNSMDNSVITSFQLTNTDAAINTDNEFFECKDPNKLRIKYLYRRRKEFYSVRSIMSVRSVFFRPKINIYDISDYMDPVHRFIRLENVYVLSKPHVSLSHKNPEVNNKPDSELDHHEPKSEIGSANDTMDGMNELETIEITNTVDDIDKCEKSELIKRFLLFNINATASKSDIIGVIGRTGAGKTTLLSLLVNFSHIRKGSVLLDGVDVDHLPRDIMRLIVGVLPQLPFVFKGWTIRRFLDPRKLFTDEQINEALSKCGLLDFVNTLSDCPLDLVIMPDYYHKDIPKYLKKVYYPNLFTHRKPSRIFRTTFRLSKRINETMDFDMVLSNTQMRTLMFSRLMLYRKFYRMIVIDEPPSDNCSDELMTPITGVTPKVSFSFEPQQETTNQIGVPIYKLLSLYFKHCTSFIAAHDVNALKSCTKLWILNNGKLVMTCDKEQMLQDESLSKMIQDSMEN